LFLLKALAILFLFIPFVAVAQYRISGRVVDSATRKPVADASVFLSNASVGTKTNNDGTFTLTNVRGGQYEMVVSIIGYATYKQTVMVNKDLNLPEIHINQQAIQLQEVRIGGPDKHWADHYARFKREFIGTTDNAAECDILNPHVLRFDNDDGVFSATADGTLTIENKALGYHIKYILTAFSDNSKTGITYFAGEAFFEAMKGSKHRQKKWIKNRLETYDGSDMHFLRSVIAKKVKEEGFLVQRLIRKPNPAYKGGFDNKYLQTLVTTPLATGEYAGITDQKGEYVLALKDCLAISYNNNPLSGSILTIASPYLYFDNNGIVLNPQDATFEGSWGESRIAGMLPVDYEPPQK
jgi:CarboxypepD_reg-like domain